MTIWRIYGPDRELLAVSFSAALTYLLYTYLTASGYFVTVIEDGKAT